MVLAVLGNAILVINNLLVTFQVELDPRLDVQRSDADHEQETSREEDDVDRRVLDSLHEKLF